MGALGYSNGCWCSGEERERYGVSRRCEYSSCGLQPRCIRRVIMIEALDGAQGVLLTHQRGMVGSHLVELGRQTFLRTGKRHAIKTTADSHAGQQKREQQEVSRDSRERINGAVYGYWVHTLSAAHEGLTGILLPFRVRPQVIIARPHSYYRLSHQTGDEG